MALSTKITTHKQSVTVYPVVSIVVTEVEQTPESTYVREIRIMTKEEGTTQAVESFVLRLEGDTQGDVHVFAPQQEF